MYVRIKKIRYSKKCLVQYGSTELWLSNFGAVGLLFNPSYHGNADTIKYTLGSQTIGISSNNIILYFSLFIHLY